MAVDGEGRDVWEAALMEALRPPHAVQFVFANWGGGTLPWCRRLQQLCKIPVVMGWIEPNVPAQYRVAMVRANSWLSHVCTMVRVPDLHKPQDDAVQPACALRSHF
jgi:hypothetical protein